MRGGHPASQRPPPGTRPRTAHGGHCREGPEPPSCGSAPLDQSTEGVARAGPHRPGAGHADRRLSGALRVEGAPFWISQFLLQHLAVSFQGSRPPPRSWVGKGVRLNLLWFCLWCTLHSFIKKKSRKILCPEALPQLPNVTLAQGQSASIQIILKSCFALKRNILSRHRTCSRWFQKTGFRSSVTASVGTLPYRRPVASNEQSLPFLLSGRDKLGLSARRDRINS